MSRFDEITSRLVSEEQGLQQELAQVEKRRKNLAKSLEQVQSALRALNGHKSRKTSTPKTVTNKVVTGWITKLLEDNGPQTQESIRSAIENHARSARYSLSGVSLRIKQTLKKEPFVVVDDLWTLTTAAPTTTRPKEQKDDKSSA